MKFLRFLTVGIFFGIVMIKSEAVSWYRIYEMFRFQSFHMYGIIGTAVALGMVIVQSFQRKKMRDIEGRPIAIPPKPKGFKSYLFGGVLFGLGWALAGACPGPIYVLLGAGVTSMIVVLAAAVLGTFAYGLIRDRLPR